MREPELEIMLVEQIRWKCGNDKHNHKTRAVAAACIAKREQKQENPHRRSWSEDELMQILKEKESMTYKQLGEKYDRSAQLMRILVFKAERIKLFKEQFGCSPKSWRDLYRADQKDQQTGDKP